jgi:hypothetical protein
MATTYAFPESAQLRKIAQQIIPRLQAGRLGFQILPLQDFDDTVLIWEQKDNYTGLQQIRGMNGEPPKVNAVGYKRYMEIPGVYGEQMPIDELQMTRRAMQYSLSPNPVNVEDLVVEKQEQMLVRELDRQELTIWNLLLNGTFSVSHLNGAVMHTGTYSLQTATGSNWSVASSATPLADLRTIQQLGPPKGVNFGAGSMAIMNRVTANYLFANTNAADLGGKKGNFGASIDSLPGVNAILTGEDLPTVMVYDQGYLNDSNTYTRFLTNRTVLIVGQRVTGESIGNYLLTRNANNPNVGPGSYSKVEDQTEGVPPRIVVHRGHNGGPVMYFPSAVVVLTV